MACGFKPHDQWKPPWLRLWAPGRVPASPLVAFGFKPHGQWKPPWLRLQAPGRVPASPLVALGPGPVLATQAVPLGPRACAGLEQRTF